MDLWLVFSKSSRGISFLSLQLLSMHLWLVSSKFSFFKALATTCLLPSSHKHMFHVFDLYLTASSTFSVQTLIGSKNAALHRHTDKHRRSNAVSEDRAHDLRIMRPTRCQLHYHRLIRLPRMDIHVYALLDKTVNVGSENRCFSGLFSLAGRAPA